MTPLSLSPWSVGYSSNLDPQKGILVQRHTISSDWIFSLSQYAVILGATQPLLKVTESWYFHLLLWARELTHIRIKRGVVTSVSSRKPGHSLDNLEFSHYINLVENLWSVWGCVLHLFDPMQPMSMRLQVGTCWAAACPVAIHPYLCQLSASVCLPPPQVLLSPLKSREPILAQSFPLLSSQELPNAAIKLFPKVWLATLFSHKYFSKTCNSSIS